MKNKVGIVIYERKKNADMSMMCMDGYITRSRYRHSKLIKIKIENNKTRIWE